MAKKIRRKIMPIYFEEQNERTENKDSQGEKTRVKNMRIIGGN